MSHLVEPHADADTIRKVASEAKPDLQDHLNCGPISDAICTALKEKLGLPAHVENGNVRDGGAYDEHAYVMIPAGHVEGKHGDVIVDGSIRQFCDENREEGRTWVSLGARSELPEIAVIGSRSNLHDKYVEHVPF